MAEKKFKHKLNRGSIFRNDRKEEDTHPDHKGSCKISCECGKNTEYWVSAWINETSGGKRYFSLAFNKKEEQTTRTPAKDDMPKDFDKDIPF